MIVKSFGERMPVIILRAEVRDGFDRDRSLLDLRICIVANMVWETIKRAAL